MASAGGPSVNVTMSSQPTSVGDEGVPPLETATFAAKPIDPILEKGYENEKVFSAEELAALAKTVFKDERWQHGRQHLEKTSHLNHDDVRELLRQGAKAFGFWHLSDFVLSGPIDHIVADQDHPHEPSIGVMAWLQRVQDKDNTLDSNVSTRAATAISTLSTMSETVIGVINDLKKQERAAVKSILHAAPPGWKNSFVRTDVLVSTQMVPTITVLVISTAYAIDVVTRKYPQAIETFGWPIIVARAGGMGAALWTALIYVTMSREFLSWLAKLFIRCRLGTHWISILDAHKEIHMFSGKALFVTSIGHVIAHSIGTVPGILKANLDDLNNVLGCAVEDPPYIAKLNLEFARWPACPLERIPKSFTEVATQTMPGLTGVILMVLICVITYTGADTYRRQNYEYFWYLHNIAIIVWPILLFFHGSQGWVGLGVPLVILVCGLPLFWTSHYRITRFLRYYISVGPSVQIESVTIRAGRAGGPKGALTNIKITKPKWFWNYRSGMYAFICMPEYAALQWHPFTICSGVDEDTVNFIIAGIGDWTIALAQRCLDAQAGGSLPVVALDGPYMAPTQTALQKKVFVAVGAGVGITPFLSLMSSFSSLLTDTDESNDPPLLEAHFFWMTRSADEFLLGRQILAKIVRNKDLKTKIFFHLYNTAKEDAKDPAAIMFREAVRRQSAVDRKAFTDGVAALPDPRSILTSGSQFPHCWALGSKHDVVWVREIVREDSPSDKAPESASGHGSVEHPDEHGHTEEDHPAFVHLNKKRHKTLFGRKVTEVVPEASKSSLDLTADLAAKTGKMVGEISGVRRKTQKLEQQLDLEGAQKETHGDWMVPVIFGRPDFLTEIKGIGLARPNENVHVYICGNDMIVKSIQEVVKSCNHISREEARQKGQSKRQMFHVHFERFG